MICRTVLSVSVAVLLLSTIGRAGDAKKDEAQLKGTWTVISEEDNGKASKVKDATVTIGAGKITVKVKGKKDQESTYKVDTTKKPKAIDIVVDDGKKSKLGIYELDGDTLKLCFGEKARPTEFKTSQESPGLLLVLKREKK